MNRQTQRVLVISALLIPFSGCVLEEKLGEDVRSSDSAEEPPAEDEPGSGTPGELDEPDDAGSSSGSSGGAETDGDPPSAAPTCDDGPGTVPHAVLDCDFPGGYGLTAVRTGEEGPPRLWITGVYQTHSDHSGGNHPTGAGHVQFDLPGENVLVVSSYEPVDWTIELGPDAELSRVIAIGYHEQTVDAPEGVLVETFSYETGDEPECGYSLPGDGGGCEGEDLVAWAEAHTELTMSGFDGCYDASQFHYQSCGQ